MKPRLVKYEYAFADQCRKLKLHLTADEDHCPIVRAKGKRLKKYLIMCPFSRTHFGIIILATSGKMKNRFIRKIKETKAENKIWVEGDMEAIVLVKNEDMAKVIKPLKFIRTRNLTDEQRKEIGERLAKSREAKND